MWNAEVEAIHVLIYTANSHESAHLCWMLPRASPACSRDLDHQHRGRTPPQKPPVYAECGPLRTQQTAETSTSTTTTPTPLSTRAIYWGRTMKNSPIGIWGHIYCHVFLGEGTKNASLRYGLTTIDSIPTCSCVFWETKRSWRCVFLISVLWSVLQAFAFHCNLLFEEFDEYVSLAKTNIYQYKNLSLSLKVTHSYGQALPVQRTWVHRL